MYLFHCSIFNSGNRPERLRVSCSSAYDPNAVKNSVDNSTIPSSVDNSSTSEGKILGKNDEYKLVKLLKKRLSREGGSFVAMSRLFEKMDLDGNGVVDFEEFTTACHEMDLVLTKQKVQMLFNYFDEDRSGCIDVNEFYKGVREPIFEERIMSNKITCSYEPIRLAPGIRSNIDLYLSAEVEGVVECKLSVVESSTCREIELYIRAYVVSSTIFKTLQKELELLHNDPEYNILKKGVKTIGKVAHAHGSLKSLEEESNLDDEELAEIKDMPIVHGCYFDPWTKTMKCDPDLLKVIVDPTWSVYESELEAKAMWAERYFQLSSKGMYSSDVMEREEHLQANRRSRQNTADPEEESLLSTESSVKLPPIVDKIDIAATHDEESVMTEFNENASIAPSIASSDGFFRGTLTT
tara:strand:+ start:2510 stop:3736 length:1227 start_codon:yes stop_codon:yes gene_type:complete